MASPDERAGRIRGNLNSRAANLASNVNERTDRIRGNLTAREQRQTKGLIEGLQALAVPERQPPRLTRVEPRGSIPAARGYAETAFQPGTGTQGGGIASPLTEGQAGPPDSGDPLPAGEVGTPRVERTYYEFSDFIYSNDFAIAVVIQPMKTLKMYDANGGVVEMRLADPQVDPGA